jgi:asparagine synthase (glutamine-hydrolysing)
VSQPADAAGTAVLAPDRPWTVAETTAGRVSVRGRAFAGETLLDGTALAAHFGDAAALDGPDPLAEFAAALDALNGFFAVVVERPDETFAGVDHVHSIPLVYAPAEGLVSDDARRLADRLGAGGYDPLAESELLVSGNVLGDRTLVPGLRALRPGEAVKLVDGEAERTRYAAFEPRTDEGVDDGGALERLERAVDAAFDRLSTVVGDRQVALALSGGADSRLVATELAARDHDVVTYSFGTSGNEDVRVAREVAAALDLQWEIVAYSTDSWREWYVSPERAAFVDRAFTYDSIPNYGTVPALSELRDRGVLDDDAVCSSGQTVAGVSENVPAAFETPAPDADDVVDAVLEYWARWGWENPAFDRVVRERIAAAVADGGEPAADGSAGEIDSFSTAFAAFERWKHDERHTKYFVADVRQYDFFGLDWWLPLWDREVVAAWANVSVADRRRKRAYADLVDRRFAAQTGLDRAAATAFTVESEAPTFAGRLIDAAAERVVDSPVAPYLRGVYWRLQRARSDYGDHPLGWYGIVPPELFARLYSGREDVHALQTLEAVGRASFVEGTVTDPPRDGVLSLPYRGGGSGGGS